MDEKDILNELTGMLRSMDAQQRAAFREALLDGRIDHLQDAAERVRSGSTASAKAERQAALQAEYEQAVRRPGTTRSERLNIRDQYRRRGLESLGGVEQQAPAAQQQVPHETLLANFRREMATAGNFSTRLMLRGKYREFGLSEAELSDWKGEE